jgi:hypothetical protein
MRELGTSFVTASIIPMWRSRIGRLGSKREDLALSTTLQESAPKLPSLAMARHGSPVPAARRCFESQTVHWEADPTQLLRAARRWVHVEAIRSSRGFARAR